MNSILNETISLPSEIFDVPYGSQFIRLSWRELLIATIAILILCISIPPIWSQFEPIQFGPDYRIPYRESNDYWLYERYCNSQNSNGEIRVVGDSVVWGEYVSPDQTLSHCLSETTGSPFCNMGVNGTHPLALEGLLQYYSKFNAGEKVILHFNPLWISSPRHDLQITKEFAFNHPKLVPQFDVQIPCYRADFSDRFSIVFERTVPFMRWVNHLRVAYFNNLDFPSWSIEHPYTDPFIENIDIFEPSRQLRHNPIPWTESGIQKQDFDWINLQTSLQWAAFKRTVTRLREQEVSVVVFVGPFNEHLLTESSLHTYQKLISEISSELSDENIPFWIPEALPSSLYADSSHPLHEGYNMMAQHMMQNKLFQQWIQREG
ncbi:MAG: hypothetical protein JXR73_08565 [Candidatus Omnitrophica bacterium]|nr:hypothetical protein [Candidatus Omnitrophota bacterium]